MLFTGIDDLLAHEDLGVTGWHGDGGARIVVRTRAEIEGETRPACVADQVVALY